MAKVFLRTYNREIESMIEGGQLDEAVAHCQYILKTFPMHVDTYRLLGKAFLEARRYADAADIFQRVLMAVPDDFVSHVGMSIIRDDENKMDDAIWHMERAFEVQPSNSAIQAELRRLYGRRDGVEPSKIRLSRDALANMYSQGELFNQAIAEIRSVLAEDTNRPDLQVMLARAYYRSGQKVEAAEMAAGLLNKYPYCMDSLRVLVEVLPGTARAENTQVYRQRLHNLDPYSSFTVNSVFTSDQVADSAVNLERLDYKSGSTTISSQPDWASSLGIKLNDEKQADTPPAWMQTSETPGQLDASTPEQTGSEVPPVPAAAAADSVPEWMRSAGWQESDKEEQVGSPDSGEQLPDEAIAKADIPDWLKSMAPTESTVETNPEPEEPAEILPVGEDGVPDWLKPTSPLEPAGTQQSDVQQPEEPQTDSEASVPDWLNSIKPADAMNEADVEAPVQPVEPQSVSADDNPNRPKSMATAESGGEAQQTIDPQRLPADAEAASEDEIPDWLKSMAPGETVDEVPAEAQQPVEPPQVPVEAETVSADEIPDWLKSMTPGGTVDEVPAEAQQPVEPSQVPVEPESASADEIPDWLKSMALDGANDEANVSAPIQPVEPQQEPVESRPVSADEVPDWIKSSGSIEAVGIASTEIRQPIEPQQTPVESQYTGSDDGFDWLKSLDSAESAGEVTDENPQQSVEPQQALVEPVPASTVGVPDWFKSLTPDKAVEEVPAEVAQPSIEPQAVGLDATPDWLKPLASADDPGETLVEAAQSPAETHLESEEGVPDRLNSVAPAETSKVSEDISAQVPGEPTSDATEPETIPAEPPSIKTDAFPDWLTGMGSRADAAALTAKRMEQPPNSEPPAQAAVPSPIPPADSNGESFQPTGEVKPLNIGDDAFSWLESLAAKQGAKPEELLTNPDERSGEMPDWLRQPDEKAADVALPPAPESISTPPETLPLEPLAGFDKVAGPKPAKPLDEVLPINVNEENSSFEGPAESIVQQADQAENGGDGTMAWLESFSTDQENKPEEPLASPAADSGTTADWMQSFEGERQAGFAMEEEISAPPEQAPAQEDISITSWLSKLDVDDDLGKESTKIPADTLPAPSSEEIPNWMKNLEKTAAPVEASKTDNDLPEWLRHPISSESPEPVASTSELVTAPESEIPAWMEESAPDTGQAAPTMPEEWLPAEIKSGNNEPAPSNTAKTVVEPTQPVTAIPQAESTPISIQSPVRLPTLKQTGMLSHIPALDKDAELLSSAQNVLDQNSLDDAMKKYTKLIKKGRLLDEVIHDLREAIYRYPVDVIIWQTLGDAYMRANRLQDALDAFTKAEELLR